MSGRFGAFTPDGMGLSRLMQSEEIQAHVHGRAERVPG